MLVNVFDYSDRKFTMAGVCPHCKRDSAFLQVTDSFENSSTCVSALQCQGCSKFILGEVRPSRSQRNFAYLAHYPLTAPDDTVAPEIPDHIQPDFKEALRCMYVNAYNASAEMCRRALEASCIEQGVTKKINNLEKMIDSLEEQRKITPHLKDVAHKIRLGGNRAAHPPESGAPEPEQHYPEGASIEIIEKEHAEAIVEFTRHFFHHIYVIPKQLDKYDFTKPRSIKS